MKHFLVGSLAFLLSGFLLLVDRPVRAQDVPAPPAAAQEASSDTSDSSLHYKNAVQLYQKKAFPEAIDELEQAVDEDPDYKEAYYLLGYAYYKVGKMDLSRDAFNQAYDLDPNYSPIPPK